LGFIILVVSIRTSGKCQLPMEWALDKPHIEGRDNRLEPCLDFLLPNAEMPALPMPATEKTARTVVVVAEKQWNLLSGQMYRDS